MDRFAMFVDAGHLLAEGGKLCLGVRSRSRFACNYADVVKALVELARDHSGDQLLRVYWYDGAYQGIPSLEHLKVAALPNVKLRLGRMSGGKQKGVDSLIVRDLMTLGRERAMSTAYVLAGDEDLREGVKDAQDFGVRVVLLGVRSLEARGNQAETLVQEADEHVILEEGFWAPNLTLVQVAEQITLQIKATTPRDEELTQRAREIGASFAREWINRATTDDVLELMKLAPVVPRELDAELLAEGRRGLPTREKPWLSKELRAGFWALVRKHESHATLRG